MSSNNFHCRDNGYYFVKSDSTAWFRAWFGEYNTDGFAEKHEACRHCKKRLAMAGECYLGLCADCWTSLLWHCLDVANRQIDRHPEKWKGSEREGAFATEQDITDWAGDYAMEIIRFSMKHHGIAEDDTQCQA